MKRISFLVGPNGCGKTKALVIAAKNNVLKRKNVIAIANTSFVRFPWNSDRFPVFRVSPRGIKKIVKKNIQSLFDLEGKDVFDISNILVFIGFTGDVGLEVEINPKSRNTAFVYNDLIGVFSSRYERDVIIGFHDTLRTKKKVTLQLASTFDSFQRGLSEDNRIILKHSQMLEELGIISASRLVFYHEVRGVQNFDKLSSGEQTLISIFLFIKANLGNLDYIYIDEPENSLHPDWQRKYIEFIHMAIGYHEVPIILATHSPILVSGSLASYKDAVTVIRVKGDEQETLEINLNDESESIEDILWEAFDTITPVSHFLSVELSRILQAVTDGELPQEEARAQILVFQNQSYDLKQKKLLEVVLDRLSGFVTNA